VGTPRAAPSRFSASTDSKTSSSGWWVRIVSTPDSVTAGTDALTYDGSAAASSAAPERASLSAKRSGPTDQWARLCGADYEIVKVAARFEPARLVDSAGLHRLEAGRPN